MSYRRTKSKKKKKERIEEFVKAHVGFEPTTHQGQISIWARYTAWVWVTTHHLIRRHVRYHCASNPPKTTVFALIPSISPHWVEVWWDNPIVSESKDATTQQKGWMPTLETWVKNESNMSHKGAENFKKWMNHTRLAPSGDSESAIWNQMRSHCASGSTFH